MAEYEKMTDETEIAMTANAWPFEEARALYNEKLGGKLPEKGYVLFETGYGPSGLPHIGTFGEVARTTMRTVDVEQFCSWSACSIKNRFSALTASGVG